MQSQRQSEQSTVALKEAFRRKHSRGKHVDLIQQGNCLRQSLASEPTLAITRFGVRRNQKSENHFRANPISFEIGKSSIPADRSFRIGKKFSHSLTLSFFGFGLFRETNSAHAVMTSSRLHFTLDKTALTCCIQSLKNMQSLQSDAIRSSCTSVPRSGLQSYDAYGDIRAQCKKSTCTHSEESGRAGHALSIQGGNMIISVMSNRNSITFKPIRDYSQLGSQSLQNISSHIFGH